MRMDNFIVNGKEADILLYGEIADNPGDGDVVLAADIVSGLMRISQECDNIRLHINSVGGEVYAGIAIFNALRSCPKNIEIYTDGISASIAGIIAICGRKHYMSKYARLMIHSVSAGVYGNKGDLKATIEEIESLENTLAEIISSKLKCSPEEVKNRFFDGKDHWFTAGEAVDLGLADGIYDLGLEGVSEKDTMDDVYRKTFTNRALIRSKISNNMDISKFKEKPRFANVTSEEQVLKTIDDLLAQLEASEKETEQLRVRVKELEESAIERILDEAVKAGKIEEGEKETYRPLMNSNRAQTEKILSGLKPKRSVKADIGGGVDSQKGAWDSKMAEIRNKQIK